VSAGAGTGSGTHPSNTVQVPAAWPPCNAMGRAGQDAARAPGPCRPGTGRRPARHRGVVGHAVRPQRRPVRWSPSGGSGSHRSPVDRPPGASGVHAGEHHHGHPILGSSADLGPLRAPVVAVRPLASAPPWRSSPSSTPGPRAPNARSTDSPGARSSSWAGTCERSVTGSCASCDAHAKALSPAPVAVVRSRDGQSLARTSRTTRSNPARVRGEASGCWACNASR
jgi:hypothetical protein